MRVGSLLPFENTTAVVETYILFIFAELMMAGNKGMIFCPNISYYFGCKGAVTCKWGKISSQNRARFLSVNCPFHSAAEIMQLGNMGMLRGP